MPSRQLSFPVFDADNHFYETREALTKFLPAHAKNAAQPRSHSWIEPCRNGGNHQRR